MCLYFKENNTLEMHIFDQFFPLKIARAFGARISNCFKFVNRSLYDIRIRVTVCNYIYLAYTLAHWLFGRIFPNALCPRAQRFCVPKPLL